MIVHQAQAAAGSGPPKVKGAAGRTPAALFAELLALVASEMGPPRPTGAGGKGASGPAVAGRKGAEAKGKGAASKGKGKALKRSHKSGVGPSLILALHVAGGAKGGPAAAREGGGPAGLAGKGAKAMSLSRPGGGKMPPHPGGPGLKEMKLPLPASSGRLPRTQAPASKAGSAVKAPSGAPLRASGKLAPAGAGRHPPPTAPHPLLPAPGAQAKAERHRLGLALRQAAFSQPSGRQPAQAAKTSSASPLAQVVERALELTPPRTLTLSLQPAHLGQVQVRITSQRGQLTIHIVAQSAQTLAALQSGAGEVASMLSAGLKGPVTVKLSHGGDRGERAQADGEDAGGGENVEFDFAPSLSRAGGPGNLASAGGSGAHGGPAK